MRIQSSLLLLYWRRVLHLSVRLVGLCLVLGACTRAEPVASDPAASGSARTASLPDRYVALSVEVACLARKETDPTALADGTWGLYRKHGFTPVHTWLEQLDTLGKDPALQRQIADGIRRCR